MAQYDVAEQTHRFRADALAEENARYDEQLHALRLLHAVQSSRQDAIEAAAKAELEHMQAIRSARALEHQQTADLRELDEQRLKLARERADEEHKAMQTAMQTRHSAATGSLDRETELGAAQRGITRTAAEGAPGSLREQITGRGPTGGSSALLAEVADNEARRDLRLAQLEEEHEFYEERLRLASDDQNARQELVRIEQEQAQLAHASKLDQLRIEGDAERRRVQEAQQRARIRTQIYQQGTRDAIAFARTMATTAMQQAKVEKDRVAQLREAGKTQAEAERQARGETLKTYGGQLVGMAIGHGAEAVGAAASFNWPKMALHLAAAGALGAAGGTLIARGNAMGAGSGDGRIEAPPAVGSFPAGAGTTGEGPIDSPIPPSPHSGTVPTPGGGGTSSDPPVETHERGEDRPPIKLDIALNVDGEAVASAVQDVNGGY